MPRRSGMAHSGQATKSARLWGNQSSSNHASNRHISNRTSKTKNRSIRMRAIIIQQFGGLDSLVIENLPDPVPQPGFVLIEVKEFGINHAETPIAKGEWAEAAAVSGIECVGSVKSCPGGEFAVGTKVAA